ncbi:MAG: glycoside hydrolase family 127 protein [Acidobacteria bacterium]|nr:glycoside hydrolase family 127 protein [Acidobacteriota bacterium]
MTRPRTLWRGAACLLAAVSLGGQQAPARDYAIRAVPFQEVVVDDEFWAPKIEVNRRVSLPHIFDQNEKTGRIENFEKGAGLKSGKYVGRRFNDTDVYKAIEAAAYTLRVHPDAALQQRVDAIARLIAGSQQPDGYLYPARTIDPANPPNGVGPERWALLSGSHELYNAGHLYEAALAVRQATGSEVLWQAALKNAELVRQVFLVGGRCAVLRPGEALPRRAR